MLLNKSIEFRFNPSLLNQHKWNILRTLWETTGNKSLTFTFEPEGWFIRESIDTVPVFQLRRDCINLNRYTDLDTFGLLGLSLINLKDSSCIIVEGVSDYISAKLCMPDKNILGVTQLGGSHNAKQILVSMFDNIIICSDNDTAGLNSAFKWKTLFDKFNIKSTIWQPSFKQFKDLTDEFLFNLKLYQEQDGEGNYSEIMF